MDWVSEGSAREDDYTIFPSGRFRNHFHHPLRDWSAAGLNDFFSGQSSVVWAQTRAQRAAQTGSWSWQETRDRFALALTSALQEDRDRWLAQTFRGLGHQLHLIQDAASVPHARNESHVTGFSLESWTRDKFQAKRPGEFALLLGQTPRIQLDPALFGAPADPRAPAPISKLIDANQYTGGNPGATATLQNATDATGQPVKLSSFGLAEYTNANFFHRDTIFAGDLYSEGHKWYSPYPKRSSTNLAAFQRLGYLTETVTAEDGEPDTSMWIAKVTDGEAIPFFLKPTYASVFTLETGRTDQILTFQLDDRVYEEYARRLLPRAVGYSTSLLDYFFRGKVDLVRVPNPDTNAPSFRIVNRSPEALGAGGIFTLYQDDDQGIRSAVAEAALTLSADVPKDNDASPLYLPIPENLSAKGLTMVYQGPLGAEQGAVFGKALVPPRIERIYLNYNTNEWMLQTAGGLYGLPVKAVAGLSFRPGSVRWGELDNQLVAVTWPDDPDIPFEALLFEINRPVGSGGVPTTGQLTPQGYPLVDLRLLQRVPLYEVLGGINLNTTVDFTEHLEFTQYMPRYSRTITCQDLDPDPRYDSYSCTTTWVGDDAVEHIGTWRNDVTANFSLQLVPEQNESAMSLRNWKSAERYAWRVADLWADRAGHLIATAQITLAPLAQGTAIRCFPVLWYSGGSLVPSGYNTCLTANPTEPAISVLGIVDLTDRRLLAKSSADFIRLEKTQRRILPSPADGVIPVGVHYTAVYVGGSLAGQYDWLTSEGPLDYCRVGTPPSGRDGAVLSLEVGTGLDRAEGMFQSSLAALGLGTGQPRLRIDQAYVPYRTDLDGTKVNLRLSRSIPGYVGPVAPSSWWNRRWWFGPLPGWLGFQADGTEWPTSNWVATQSESRTGLAKWDLEADTASLVYDETGQTVAGSVTGNSRGVFLSHAGLRSWMWVPWTGPRLVFADKDPNAAWDYVAIDPDHLLNLQTGQLYILAPGLPPDPDSLPFPPGGSRFDSYHIIGR